MREILYEDEFMFVLLEYGKITIQTKLEGSGNNGATIEITHDDGELRITCPNSDQMYVSSEGGNCPVIRVRGPR